MWSNVGSAGTVDVADIRKVVFINSVVQLGLSLLPPLPRLAAAAAPPALLFPEVQARVRYGITPQLVASVALLKLRLHFRDGAGQVIATLIEVGIPFSIGGSENAVPETSLITFDSQLFPGNRSEFRTHEVLGTANRALDFVNNAYYVELLLKAPERPIVTPDPPAVSTIQLLGTD
jgi:hypothetical protein